MHVHKLVVSTPNKRAKSRKTISEVRKICPSDGLFRHFGPKKRPSQGEKNILLDFICSSASESSEYRRPAFSPFWRTVKRHLFLVSVGTGTWTGTSAARGPFDGALQRASTKIQNGARYSDLLMFLFRVVAAPRRNGLEGSPCRQSVGCCRGGVLALFSYWNGSPEKSLGGVRIDGPDG